MAPFLEDGDLHAHAERRKERACVNEPEGGGVESIGLEDLGGA